MSTDSEEKVEITNPDTAMAVVANYYDVDEELKPEAEVLSITKTKVKGKQSYNIKLSAGNLFSGYSLEDALSKVYGSNSKYYDWYKSTGTLRKCINLTAMLSTRAGFETTISCLNKDDDPTKKKYMDAKHQIDELNHKVNMDHVLLITQIKRYLYGNAGWEIVPDTTNSLIMAIQPLRSSFLVPIVDKKGFFQGVEYYPAKDKVIPKSKLLYFNLDALDNDKTSLLGIPIVRSVERNIKIVKNLERDLLYAARSLWAPIVIYNADMRGLTPTEKAALVLDLKTDLKPGAVVICNRPVVPQVVQYNPDLNNLIQAMAKQDEDIIGTFGIPKALLSREKTTARATLEFSIRAFYEATIAGDQTYLKRELEKQWYDPLIKRMGLEDKIRIRHEWRPILDPQSELVVALVRAYESGVIGGTEFFRRLGWELDRVEEEAKETRPPPRKPNPPENEGEKDEE